MRWNWPLRLDRVARCVSLGLGMAEHIGRGLRLSLSRDTGIPSSTKAADRVHVRVVLRAASPKRHAVLNWCVIVAIEHVTVVVDAVADASFVLRRTRCSWHIRCHPPCPPFHRRHVLGSRVCMSDCSVRGPSSSVRVSRSGVGANRRGIVNN